MISLFILFLTIFLTSDLILDFHGWKGIYFLIHALHNVLIGFLTFPSMKRILFQQQNSIFSEESLLSPTVGGMVYALHAYHISRYYHQINTPEKVHHVVSLGIVIPLSHMLFSNHDLLALSLFSTTGWATVVHYIFLFLYKNHMYELTKKDVLSIGHWSNTYVRYPLIISNASFLIQYLVTSFDQLTTSQIYTGCLLFCILLWNGYYFRYLVEKSYYDAVIRNRIEFQ